MEGVVQLGQEDTAVEHVSLETSNEEEEDAESEGQDVPLEGLMLGVINYNEEEPVDLAQARLAVIPWMLFTSMSQPSSSDPEHERRPLFSQPPNPPIKRRSKRIAQVMDRRRESATGEPTTPILVASQASMSEIPDPNISMN